MLTKCKISTANTAGFCFGVDRAVKIVYNNLDTISGVVTLGPIIHNPNVVADFEKKGIYSIDEISEIKDGQTVIIRSHGVGKSVYDELNRLGINTIDATCPFVTRIHKIVREKSTEGFLVLIAGDSNHPEIIGIRGHCSSKSIVFADEKELKDILLSLEQLSDKKIAIIAQTTYNVKSWQKCVDLIDKYAPHAFVSNTICSATSERQNEAVELSKASDVMLIVGGKHSSNTIKLLKICELYCKRSYHIESAEELRSIDFSNISNIGISAGASTPAYIIKEVQSTMSDILNDIDEDFNFEEALEQTFKKIYTGNRVKGYITSVSGNEVIVDIGTKHTGIIPLSELTNDSSLKASDVVSVGEEIDLVILKTNDQEGIVTLSKRKVDAAIGLEKIAQAKEDGTTLTGVVTNVVRGGVIVATNGARVFIPASQSSVRRDEKLDILLKKTVQFKIIEVNQAQGKAVGSIRELQKQQRVVLEAKFFETANEGDLVTGEVKSITDYGVFVDLGGTDGLIRKSDLTWKRIKHPSDVVSIGDKIEVTIKDIDREAKKVSLSYKKESDNPWNVFASSYEVGAVVPAKIVSITAFGAFAQIVPGIDGLIHISQIANQRVNNISDVLAVGQTVDAKITEIDIDKKRISLSIRAIAEDGEVESSDEE